MTTITTDLTGYGYGGGFTFHTIMTTCLPSHCPILKAEPASTRRRYEYASAGTKNCVIGSVIGLLSLLILAWFGLSIAMMVRMEHAIKEVNVQVGHVVVTPLLAKFFEPKTTTAPVIVEKREMPLDGTTLDWRPAATVHPAMTTASSTGPDWTQAKTTEPVPYWAAGDLGAMTVTGEAASTFTMTRVTTAAARKNASIMGDGWSVYAVPFVSMGLCTLGMCLVVLWN
jgi:hypothetical protein